MQCDLRQVAAALIVAAAGCYHSEAGDVVAGGESRFADPAPEYGLIQYQLKSDTLRRYPEWGIGGFLAFFYEELYQQGVPGPRKIAPLVGDAAALHMPVWLADDFGYPSGMAGGKVVEDHPEYEVRGLARHMASGRGEGAVTVELPKGAEKFVAAVIYPVSGGEVDLANGQVRPVEDGVVRTEGLPGEWQLSTFFRVIRSGQALSTAEQFKHTGRYPDIMNPAAVASFLSHMHEPIYEHVQESGTTVKGFYTNEPHLMQLPWKLEESPFACAPWNEDIPAKFREMHGYDLWPVMDAVFTGADQTSRRTRIHFQQTVAELLR